MTSKQERFLLTCGWCGKRIKKTSEVFTVGAQARPGFHLEQHEGEIIELALILADRKVSAMIPMNDSEAKRRGNDFLFVVCSQKCGNELKRALQAEKNLIDNVN